jgi:hypothetical protein
MHRNSPQPILRAPKISPLAELEAEAGGDSGKQKSPVDFGLPLRSPRIGRRRDREASWVLPSPSLFQAVYLSCARMTGPAWNERRTLHDRPEYHDARSDHVHRREVCPYCVHERSEF